MFFFKATSYNRSRWVWVICTCLFLLSERLHIGVAATSVAVATTKSIFRNNRRFLILENGHLCTYSEAFWIKSVFSLYFHFSIVEKETIISNSKSDIRIRDAQSTQQCRIDKESYIIPRPHNCIIMMRGGKGKKLIWNWN